MRILKKYKMIIENFYIGQKETISKAFTDEDALLFSQLSMDTNPIHLNDDYAQKSIFKKRICHGFLVGSLFSAIFATKLPGPGAIYLQQDMTFLKPVYLNQVVIAEVEIIEIVLEKKIIKFLTSCFNENNELVIKGFAVIKI
jgi:3-hydroxybutyryl-CoA dehydratase